MTTPSDVRWAYKYYLGRDPEDAGVIDFYVEATKGLIDTLRGALFDSEEAQENAGCFSPQGEFCIWRPGRKKILIIGNCIGPNLGRTLAAMADASIYAIDILRTAATPLAISPFIDDADYVLAPNLGEEFGLLAGKALRDRLGDRLAFYTLTFFAGVHPDVTYLGVRGKRFHSPLGDYYSRIVVRSFVRNQSSNDCRRLFLDSSLAEGDYRRAYAESVEEYLRREGDSDIRISDWLFKEIRQQPLLYTVNHPTTAVLTEIARNACLWFGLGWVLPVPVLTSNDLSRDIIWPVHRVVAMQVGLEYSTQDVFWVNRYVMDLDEFIWRSYRLYANQDRQEFAAAAATRGLA